MGLEGREVVWFKFWFSAERRNLAKAHGRILFANSDLSGFSIFEEAQYRGVNAADRVLSQVAGAHGPTH